MRPLLRCLLALAAIPCAARAADWSVDNDRILSDPAYLPLARQITGATSYDGSVFSYDEVSAFANDPFDPQGQQIRHDRTQQNIFTQSLAYGITDTVSLDASIGFGNAHDERTFVVPVFVSGPPAFVPEFVTRHQGLRSVGATDPVFGVTWRAFDERRAPVDVDLSASYSPDIFQSREATVGSTGTIATGGQSASFEMAVSREMRHLTVQAFFDVSAVGRRNQAVGDEDQRLGAHPAFQGGVRSQVRPLSWLGLNLGVSVGQSARFALTDIAPQQSFAQQTIRPGADVQPYVGVVVQIIPNRLTLGLQYAHDFIGDEQQQGPSGPEYRFTHEGTDQAVATLRFALF